MALIRRGLVMIDYLARLGAKDTYKAKFEALSAAIDNAPAVDAEPVRHGTWIYHDDNVMSWNSCSLCGCEAFDLDDANYCPNCGAKLEKDEEEEVAE